MKKVRSRKSPGSTKKQQTPATVDEYFDHLPSQSRGALGKIRAAIRSVVPTQATEVISYGIPAFRQKRVLVWYAAFSDHCSLFPTASVIQAFKDDLAEFVTSKGTIHFPLDQPIPTALIKKLVKARVAAAGSKTR